jgi:hypothetical protein
LCIIDAAVVAKDNLKQGNYCSRLVRKSKFYLLPLEQRDKEFDAQIKQFYHYLVSG